MPIAGCALTLAITAIACGTLPEVAAAKSPIYSYSAAPSTTQAGGHPNIELAFRFGNRFTQEFPTECFCQDPKEITNILPAGVIGDPHNVPQCTQQAFDETKGLRQVNCSVNSQVGVAFIDLFEQNYREPVYNVEPHPDQAGLLGFFLPLAEVPAFIVLKARTGGDYGLDASLPGIEHLIPPEGFELDLWGVPADSSHDAERVPPGPASAEVRPFLDNPTTCGGPLSSGLETLAYDEGTDFAEAPWPAVTGCDQLTFNPSLYAQPTTDQTDSASGLDVDLSVPQIQSPSAPSPSEIRATTLTLPGGMSINPNAADGKTFCSDGEARFGSDLESNCPELAKVGTVSLTSTALPGPLPGFIYIGEPQKGNRYRIFLTANGFNTHVKLAGSVKPDPQTGQLVVTFDNLPQSPFSEFNLHFFGSERGLLATPTQCGTYPVTSTFTPWDESLAEQTSTQYFTLDRGPNGSECPAATRPFGPGLRAGVTDASAGVHSPFFIDLTRPDGSQDFAGLTVSTPPGFSATLSGIPYCPDAALAAAGSSAYSGASELASPSCPAGSQIGTATAGAGAGTHPVYLPGKVYLAGPYRGAPLSLAVITPAVTGPYDLGNVVVRAALQVNPETAQITAVSDPLPQILEGIPLRLRSILVNLDRPNFTLNPTNCDPFAVDAQISGDQGAVANLSKHFQASNCTDLSFAPKLELKLSGSTKRTGHPALAATLTARPGEANIATTTVTMPHTLFLDNAHIKAPCTRVQFAAGACPPASVLGTARAESPLLAQPLEGPVYLRASSHKLPDLVAALKGQIDINLDGRIDSVKQRLRASFENVPDVPVSKFSLNLLGGSKGLLEISENLCSTAREATVAIGGQNGSQVDRKVSIDSSCASAGRAKHRLKRAKVVG